jgi:hypothetical protein
MDLLLDREDISGITHIVRNEVLFEKRFSKYATGGSCRKNIAEDVFNDLWTYKGELDEFNVDTLITIFGLFRKYDENGKIYYQMIDLKKHDLQKIFDILKTKTHENEDIDIFNRTNKLVEYLSGMKFIIGDCK